MQRSSPLSHHPGSELLSRSLAACADDDAIAAAALHVHAGDEEAQAWYANRGFSVQVRRLLPDCQIKCGSSRHRLGLRQYGRVVESAAACTGRIQVHAPVSSIVTVLRLAIC